MCVCVCGRYLHLSDSHETVLGRVASALDCVSMCVALYVCYAANLG